MLVIEVFSATNVGIERNRISKSMLFHVDKLKLCKGDKPKTWLSGVEGDATELEDAEEEEMRRLSEEQGDELQRMEGVEHATTDELEVVEDRKSNPEARKRLRIPRPVNTLSERGMIRDNPPEADKPRVSCVTMCGWFLKRSSNEAQPLSKTCKMTTN